MQPALQLPLLHLPSPAALTANAKQPSSFPANPKWGCSLGTPAADFCSPDNCALMIMTSLPLLPDSNVLQAPSLTWHASRACIQWHNATALLLLLRQAQPRTLPQRPVGAHLGLQVLICVPPASPFSGRWRAAEELTQRLQGDPTPHSWLVSAGCTALHLF